MKTRTSFLQALMLFAAVTVGALAQTPSSETQPSVSVYVSGKTPVPGVELMAAESMVHAMFAKAGVQIKWQMHRPKSGADQQTIIIDLTSEALDGIQSHTLAYAELDQDIHITVFYDRIESLAGPGKTSMLLAHVLVHEITHILEGISRHSQSGIMKAYFTPEDIAKMAHKQLTFDPADIELIHMGLAHRSTPKNTVIALRR